MIGTAAPDGAAYRRKNKAAGDFTQDIPASSSRTPKLGEQNSDIQIYETRRGGGVCIRAESMHVLVAHAKDIVPGPLFGIWESARFASFRLAPSLDTTPQPPHANHLCLEPLLGVEPRDAVLEPVVAGWHQGPDGHDRALGLDLHRDHDVSLLAHRSGAGGGRELEPESGLVGLELARRRPVPAVFLDAPFRPQVVDAVLRFRRKCVSRGGAGARGWGSWDLDS